MNKTVSTLSFIVISICILSACAQKAPVQEPVPPVVEVSTAVPAGIGQPLSEMTPETPTPVSNSNQDGQKIVTRDAQGQTITMAVGENFLLQLGEGYTWEITISNQNVLSRVKNIAVVLGAQGIYEALQPGTVTVSAAGDPLCRQSKPACGMPSIQVDFTVVVK
jgi:hypothetical protein